MACFIDYAEKAKEKSYYEQHRMDAGNLEPNHRMQ